MRPIIVLVTFLCIVAGVTGLATAYTNNHRPTPMAQVTVEPGKPRVKLAVLVVFDQTYSGIPRQRLDRCPRKAIL